MDFLIIKFALVLVSGVLAILTIFLSNSANRNFCILRKFAILLIIVSICLGLFIHLYESKIQYEKNELDSAIFTGVKKAMLPLRPNSMAIHACYKDKDEIINHVIDSIDKNERSKYLNSKNEFKTRFAFKPDPKGEPLKGLITVVDVGFSPNKIEINSFEDFIKKTDFRVNFSASVHNSNEVTFIVDKGRDVCKVIHTTAQHSGFTAYSSHASYSIFSVPDLIGSYMYLVLRGNSVINVYPDFFIFEVYPGFIVNPQRNFEMVLLSDSVSVFEYRFPVNERDFWNNLRL